MSIVTGYSPSWTSAPRAASVRAHAPEKSGFAGQFDGESHRDAAARDKFHDAMASSDLHQSGTSQIVPDRYDDEEIFRFSAPFAAQLLGQVMEPGALPLAQARAAYRHAQQQRGLVLNTKL